MTAQPNHYPANFLQSVAAYCDAGLDVCELDDAAIRSFGAEYGVDGLALVERLEMFTQAARRSL